ncbi:hypothetical protein [Niabella ginsenosidivorans]|uniref:hypothetical protein n=1 Tax=Niabella ginsenosidivorans TaxID=1176587 RepID=UPI001C54E6A3|nr:hypothetical protein [Niabella ginsenosidivorans]
MSYDIQLFRTETRDREQQLNDAGFFNNGENPELFTETQYKSLKDRLLSYDYEIEKEASDTIEYISGVEYRYCRQKEGFILQQAGTRRSFLLQE